MGECVNDIVSESVSVLMPASESVSKRDGSAVT